MLQNLVMMSYGFFVFMRQTLPYQESQSTSNWRHPSQSVIGQLPPSQYLGKESETLTLSGVLMPEITGGEMSLLALHALAEAGEAWPLIDGSTFMILGWFVIEEISETQSVFFGDGSARRIEFSLKLKRTDTSLLAELGNLF
ncbi:oxidoreductase [Chelonobacter oris]|uniref:phage tail protein n=1 Tax=Chelonobacter oris TaxID=505317 RepID=UPI00244BC309|nr:phage tail protein [Chelonobacter oris]MDH3000949.1 oxidoreductase [Chelonobacter oris]